MRKEALIILVGLIGIILFLRSVSAIETAPKIEIEKEIYVCEGQALSYIFSGNYSGAGNLSADIYPKNPFYTRALNSFESQNLNKFEIFSGKLNKSYGGKSYEENVSIFDNELSDWKNVKINVIEINNPVEMRDLGVETIDLNTSSLFNKKVIVEDIEDGNHDGGKLVFNLSFISGKRLFGIDNAGKISFVANKSDIGKYLIEVCVRDLGIRKISDKIKLCGQDGKSSNVCKSFQLVITEKNNAPTILNKTPDSSDVAVEGNSKKLDFSISSFDPDGTNPDIYWYADNKLIEKNTEKFSYLLNCKNKTETHTVEAEVKDGLAVDKVSWIVRGVNLTCLNEENKSCEIKKGCDDWGLCQKALQSAEIGVLSQSDYDSVKKNCGKFGWADINCGYQVRTCSEFSECKDTLNNQEIRGCYFSYNPSCNDKLLNCHNGGCEELVDCGGPCSACPSCSDGKNNGGEFGIDCGGPCFNECIIYSHFYDKEGIKYLIVMFVLIFIGGIALLLRKIVHIKKEVKEIPLEKLR